MNNEDQIKKLADEALDTGKCDMCLTCRHSYFRKGDYSGYCKYVESHRDMSYSKPIFIYDVCSHWEEKDPK